MKINSNQIIESAKNNLDKLFSNSLLLNKLNDNQFKELIIKQISILNYYEKSSKVKKDKKANEYLKKLNEINNNKDSLIDVKYSKLEDALDDVNYLKTFINNVYKINLDSNQSNDEIIKAKPINNPSNVNNDFINNGNGMPMNGMFSPEMLQEQWYRKVAYDRYCAEVIKGEFYEYKSKPLSIIIFKYIIAALMVVFMISIIVKIVFQILVWDIKISNSKDPITIFGLGSASDIIMILFMSFTFYKLIKPTKNDNIKYFLQWKLLTIIFSIILISLTMNIPDLVQWYSNKQWEELNPTKVKDMHIFLIMCFVYYGEFLLIIIFVIIASVFNPKKDIERIDKKMESLYNEVKSGQQNVPKSW